MGYLQCECDLHLKLHLIKTFAAFARMPDVEKQSAEAVWTATLKPVF